MLAVPRLNCKGLRFARSNALADADFCCASSVVFVARDSTFVARECTFVARDSMFVDRDSKFVARDFTFVALEFDESLALLLEALDVLLLLFLVLCGVLGVLPLFSPPAIFGSPTVTSSKVSWKLGGFVSGNGFGGRAMYTILSIKTLTLLKPLQPVIEYISVEYIISNDQEVLSFE